MAVHTERVAHHVCTRIHDNGTIKHLREFCISVFVCAATIAIWSISKGRCRGVLLQSPSSPESPRLSVPCFVSMFDRMSSSANDGRIFSF